MFKLCCRRLTDGLHPGVDEGVVLVELEAEHLGGDGDGAEERGHGAVAHHVAVRRRGLQQARLVLAPRAHARTGRGKDP